MRTLVIPGVFVKHRHANGCFFSPHPYRGIRDVSHLPIPRDHPAEGHSPLFLAVWNVPLSLLSRQHQDRLPGCDGQEGAAPRQSQLNTIKPGLGHLSRPPLSPIRRADAEVAHPLPFDSLKGLSESNWRRVWPLFSRIMAQSSREWDSKADRQSSGTVSRWHVPHTVGCIWFVVWLRNPPPLSFFS